MDPVGGFLASAVRIATPLLWAGLGELLAERAGVINLAVEGAMLAGCLAAAIGAATSGDPWFGVAAGMAAGGVVAAVFAGFAVWGRANQIITGTALTLAAVGVTGVWYRHAFGALGAGLSLPTLAPFAVPGLSQVPVLGPSLFHQPLLTYLAFGAVPMIWWFLFRTTAGLRLRATGEAATAAAASGVRVRRVQGLAVTVGGLLAGLGGATLVLAQVGTFSERMTAGRGFIAIAIVVLGRWHPGGVLVAALGFGLTNAIQFAIQALGWSVPYQLLLMLPYLVALVALTGVVGRARAPGQLGQTVA
jgi:simple sugar transport system permease protein